MSTHKPTPVGGPMMTPTVRVLLFVFLVGAALTVWRFAVGLGPSTGLSVEASTAVRWDASNSPRPFPDAASSSASNTERSPRLRKACHCACR